MRHVTETLQESSDSVLISRSVFSTLYSFDCFFNLGVSFLHIFLSVCVSMCQVSVFNNLQVTFFFKQGEFQTVQLWGQKRE